jgi:hypothetical protein
MPGTPIQISIGEWSPAVRRLKQSAGLYTLLVVSATRNRGCSKQLVVFRVVCVSLAELIYFYRLCQGQ